MAYLEKWVWRANRERRVKIRLVAVRAVTILNCVLVSSISISNLIGQCNPFSRWWFTFQCSNLLKIVIHLIVEWLFKANPYTPCSQPPCSAQKHPISPIYSSLCHNKPCPPFYPFQMNPNYVNAAQSYPSWPSYPSYASLPSYPSLPPSGSSSLPSLASLPSNVPIYDPSLQGKTPTTTTNNNGNVKINDSTSTPQTSDDTANDSFEVWVDF